MGLTRRGFLKALAAVPVAALVPLKPDELELTAASLEALIREAYPLMKVAPTTVMVPPAMARSAGAILAANFREILEPGLTKIFEDAHG